MRAVQVGNAANRLRELREAGGYKLRDLANVVDRDQSTYWRYETGETRISTDHARALAAFHGCSMEYLLGYSDDGAPVEAAA